jgi:hypothetical protein
MRENKWQIPFKSGTGDYTRAFLACRKFDKPYPELTDEEKGVKTPKTKENPIVGSSEAMLHATTALTEEITALSLEIVELRIAFRRAGKQPPIP